MDAAHLIGTWGFVAILSSCAPTVEAPPCDVARAYLDWEISGDPNTALVFSTERDESSTDLNWLSANRRDAMITEFARTPWFVLDGQNPWNETTRFREAPKTPGEIELVRRLFDADSLQNAIAACPAVRDILETKEIEFGSKAVDAASAIIHRDRDEHSKTIATAYLPIISEDGQSGIVVSSRSWAPLAGAGLMLKIERQPDGRWVATKAQQLWVS